MLNQRSCPRLSPKARLRFDRRGGHFLLLYPERGMILNQAASDILHLCTGRFTVEMIVDALAVRHGADQRASIAGDVLAFLSRLQARGLVQE